MNNRQLANELFGVPVLSQEQLEARRNVRRSEAQAARHRVGLALRAVLALVGLTLALSQVVAVQPVPVLVLAGVLMMMPLINSWLVDRG